MYAASREGQAYLLLCSLLIKRGAALDPLHPRNSFGPLHKAIEHSNIEAVRKLLAARADVNAQGPVVAPDSELTFQTPLYLAVGIAPTPVPELVALILENGANTDVSDDAKRLVQRRHSYINHSTAVNQPVQGTPAGYMAWHQHGRISALLAAYNFIVIDEDLVPATLGSKHASCDVSISCAVANGPEWGPLRFAIAAGVSAQGIRVIMSRDLDNFDTYRPGDLLAEAVETNRIDRVPRWSEQTIPEDITTAWFEERKRLGEAGATPLFGGVSLEVIEYLKASNNGWSPRTHCLRNTRDRATIHLLLLIVERLRRVEHVAMMAAEPEPEPTTGSGDGTKRGNGADPLHLPAFGGESSTDVEGDVVAGNDGDDDCGDDDGDDRGGDAVVLPVLPPEIWLYVILPFVNRTPVGECTDVSIPHNVECHDPTYRSVQAARNHASTMQQRLSSQLHSSPPQRRLCARASATKAFGVPATGCWRFAGDVLVAPPHRWDDHDPLYTSACVSYSSSSILTVVFH